MAVRPIKKSESPREERVEGLENKVVAASEGNEAEASTSAEEKIPEEALTAVSTPIEGDGVERATSGEAASSSLIIHNEEKPVVVEAEVVDDTTLTNEEQEILITLENEVKTGMQMAGRALREINAKRLYRATHATFEEYCMARFGFARRHPYHLMSASEITDTLRARGVHIPSPVGEYQLRPLARLRSDSDKLVAAWERALERSDGKVPSHNVVAEVVHDIFPQERAVKKKNVSFQEGNYCVIRRTADSYLSGRKGYWARVDKVSGTTVTISLYDRTEEVEADTLESLWTKKPEREQWDNILSTMKAASEALPSDEKAVEWVLEYFGRLTKHSTLTDFENGLLSYCEQQAKKAEKKKAASTTAKDKVEDSEPERTSTHGSLETTSEEE